MSNQDKPWPIVVHVEKLQAFVDAYPRRMKSQTVGNQHADARSVKAGKKLLADWKLKVEQCRS